MYSVPGSFPSLAAAVLAVLPNDEIHIAPGWFEALPPGGLTIWQVNLWIIGAPPGLGPTPSIDLNGQTITILGTGVFIWGLNIFDSTGFSPLAINLGPTSGDCLIMRNVITGLVPGTTGILVQGSNNVITLNTLMTWGTIIVVTGPSTGNIIKLNTINPPFFLGLQVSGFAGPNNALYWNNVWAPPEFWDAGPPGSPPNWFDDTSTPGGPGYGRGNFWVTGPLPPAPIPGPGVNGWFDFFPQPAPMAQLSGDINVDGIVDLFDLVPLALRFGSVWCTFLWDPRTDLNGDGVVNIFDIVTIALNYSTSY